MKLYHFTSLLSIIIVITNRNFVESQYPPAPDELTLRIEIDQGNVVNIFLKRVKTFLANEYLPVKKTLDDKGEAHGDVDENIMSEVGEFFMYHEYCTKSAFVYFQKRGILNGVVDVTYSIVGLPIHEAHKVLKVRSKYLRFFGIKRYIKKARPVRSIDNDTSIIQTRHDRDVGGVKITVYPELLVAVGYNMHKALGNNYVNTISHVLTVYNAVDMLYRLVKSTTIYINIAAIIIETIKYAWYFIPKKFSDNGIESIRVDTVNPSISAYFSIKENQFPRYSYDFVGYNTRLPLVTATGRTMDGYAIYAPRSFIFPPGKSKFNRYNFVAHDYKLYESYTTIAHELAHVFTAKHDGEGSLYYNTATCGIKSLMAGHGCPKSCLQWSRKTEREFAAFFGSEARCILINEPRSLYPPKPRKVFTGVEQCRCYGFKSFDPPDTDSASWWCNEPMNCIDKHGDFKDAPVPLDGTPCGREKICWDQKCQPLVNDWI